MTDEQNGFGQSPAPKSSHADRRTTRFDPTWPALIAGFVLVLVAFILGVQNLFPAGALETLLDTGDHPVIASQSSQDDQNSSVEKEEDANADDEVTQALPVATSVEIFSWNDDGGDHSELAGYLLDNDPSTTWRARYFSVNAFAEGSEIALLVRLAQPALVNQITLNVTGSGGLVDVTDPQDDNPRNGEVLASATLSPQTIITLNPAVEMDSVGLVFKELPTDDEGRFRAKITAITVE